LAAAARAQGPVAPLELESSSARVAALGGAGLGLDDASDWVEAPGSLAGLGRWSLRAHEQALAGGLQRQWLEALSPWNDWVGLGAGLGYTNFGSLEARDDSGALTGSFNAQRLSGGLGLGLQPWAHWQLGLGLQGYQESLGSSSFSGLRPGASVAYRLGALGGLALSAGAQGESLGFAAALPSWPALRLAGQVDWNAALQPSVGTGAELALGWAALRAGWRQGVGDSTAALSGFSAGIGAQWGDWGLDFAWLPQGGLGDSQRFSLSYSHAPPPPAPLPTPTATLPPPDLPPPSLPSLEVPRPGTFTAAPALELEFRLPETPADEAIAAEEHGGEAKALALYQEAIKQDPTDTRAWLGLGHLYYRLHQMDAALQCFDQVIRLNPTEVALKDWVDQVRAQRRRQSP
jgi:hypothetical protein